MIFWETFEIFNFSSTVNVKSRIILPITGKTEKQKTIKNVFYYQQY